MKVLKMKVGENPLLVIEVKRIIENHKRIKKDPLLMAVWYKKNHPKNIYLLEVIENFSNVVKSEKEPFTVEFDSSSDFLLPDGGKLYLTLISPSDLKRSVDENWEFIKPLSCESFNKGEAEILHCESNYKQLLKKLKEQASHEKK